MTDTPITALTDKEQELLSSYDLLDAELKAYLAEALKEFDVEVGSTPSIKKIMSFLYIYFIAYNPSPPGFQLLCVLAGKLLGEKDEMLVEFADRLPDEDDLVRVLALKEQEAQRMQEFMALNQALLRPGEGDKIQ